MDILIIGNGVAGITAARTLRKLDPDVRVTVVSDESDLHYSRTALMYAYLGHMRRRDMQPWSADFFARNRIELLRDRVVAVDGARRTVHLRDGGERSWDRLLLATGSVWNTFGWPGQDLDRVGGLYSLQDLDRVERWSPGLERAAIVGGGLIGVELAEMLHSRGVPVLFLVREASYWDPVLPAEESQIVNEVIREAHVELRLSTELRSIEDDGQGGVGAVITSAGDREQVGMVGLTAGVRPNLSALEGSDVPTGRGVLVDRQLRSTVDGVYAAGDCVEVQGLRTAAVWYAGRAQGELVARNMLGASEDYEPGIWFNSAKFFDLEYQVYGEVPAAQHDSDLASLLWIAADRRHSVRIVHDGQRVRGFNLMGVRYRHRVCERWIAEERGVDYVLDHLREAHFDPEFTRRWDRDVVASLRGQA